MAPLRRVPCNPIVAAMSGATSSSEATLPKLARALGPKYEVRRVVGSGGFAEVYEVWDKDLERRLAVKVLRPDVAWTAGTVERFQRETRAAAHCSSTSGLRGGSTVMRRRESHRPASSSARRTT